MFKVIIFVLSLLLLGQAQVAAQDFKALLDAVDKVAADLKTLVAKEAQTRQQELQSVRKDIDQLKTAPGAGSADPTVAALAAEVQALKAEVQRLSSQPTSAPANSDQLAALTGEITALKADLSALRASTEENQKMLVSLDEEGFYVPEEQNQMLEQIYQRLGSINEQMAGLKSTTSSSTTSGTTNPAIISKGKISVYGLVHEHFTDQTNERSTFTAKRAQFGLLGELNRYAQIKIIADLAGTPSLQDGELTVSPHKRWSLTVGQFKTPFGTDFLTGTPVLPFVNVAMATGLGPSRDIGASLSFRTPLGAAHSLKLTTGIFNGSGINTTDANAHKNFVFRSELSLFKMFTFAPNVLAGKTNAADSAALDLTTYGASLGWQRARTQVIGEYTYSTVGDQDKAGWYLWASQGVATGWQFLPVVEFLTRFEQLDPNRAVAENTLSRLTFGTNLLVDGKYTKLQINYELDDDGEGLGQQNRLAMNLQASF